MTTLDRLHLRVRNTKQKSKAKLSHDELYFFSSTMPLPNSIYFSSYYTMKKLFISISILLALGSPLVNQIVVAQSPSLTADFSLTDEDKAIARTIANQIEKKIIRDRNTLRIKVIQQLRNILGTVELPERSVNILYGIIGLIEEKLSSVVASNELQNKIIGIRIEILDRVNQQRAAQGLAPVKINSTLNLIAQDFSSLMNNLNFFDHTSPDGSTTQDRIDAYGYARTSFGENIAQGQTTAAEAMESRMNSESHKANILDPKFTEIGIGFYNNYRVQVFASP
ncbi:MAG TPA: CAP domain-containing protein [Candidatus Absconditabacterales bacterium]|nr:CAP domain-containing protein [Candidatus Absconditabacterales bacterium]